MTYSLLLIISVLQFDAQFDTINVGVSAYTASVDECDGDPTTTANGGTPIPGQTCAVSRDLRHLIGKHIYVDGYGIRLVNDVMNKRYTGYIDLCTETKVEAYQIGRTTASIRYKKEAE